MRPETLYTLWKPHLPRALSPESLEHMFVPPRGCYPSGKCCPHDPGTLRTSGRPAVGCAKSDERTHLTCKRSTQVNTRLTFNDISAKPAHGTDRDPSRAERYCSARKGKKMTNIPHTYYTEDGPVQDQVEGTETTSRRPVALANENQQVEEDGPATEPELSTKDMVLVEALGRGQSRHAAAELAGVSTRTVRRRWADPAFRAAVGEVRRAVVEEISGLLNQTSREAVRTLLRVMKSARPPDQVRAAEAVLSHSLRFHRQIHDDEVASLLDHPDAVLGNDPKEEGSA